jgi:hypothetical protein
MKMPELTLGQFLKAAEVMTKSLSTHAEEMPFLEKHRTKFDSTYSQVKDILAQQAELTARKQELSKQLAELVSDGRQQLSFLKVVVKDHFGKRAERLVAFGVQPLRSRSRSKVSGPEVKQTQNGHPQPEPPALPVHEPAEIPTE